MTMDKKITCIGCNLGGYSEYKKMDACISMGVAKKLGRMHESYIPIEEANLNNDCEFKTVNLEIPGYKREKRS